MAFKKVTKKMLGELLIDRGVITREQLEKALARKKETGRLLGETLIEMDLAREEDVVDAVSSQYRIPYLPLKHHDIDKELLKILPMELALRQRCFPVDRIGGVFTIAMENPLDEKAYEEICGLWKGKVLCFVSTHSEILSAIEEHYGKMKREHKEPAPLELEEGSGIKVFKLESNGLSEE
jgi:hypothetical protein